MTVQRKSVVILAAGKGTRMYSELPKVLHLLAGKPMVQHVIDTAKSVGASDIHLVYGHGGDLLKEKLGEQNLNWVLQAEQLGTGHAMQQAAPHFQDDEDIIMLYGDVPLIAKDTLQRLIEAKPEGGIGLLTVILDNPTGYGRIIRENGEVVGIIEQKTQLKSNVRSKKSILGSWLQVVKTLNVGYPNWIIIMLRVNTISLTLLH